MSTGIDLRRLTRLGRSQQGFSVLEVLLTLVASTLVATGIGSMMVSSIRSQGRTETYNRLQGSWYQAANLLEVEASLAERIQSAPTGSTGCANLATGDVKLVLVGPGNAWRSYYGVRARIGGETTLWYGPNLLVRCGQPFKPTTAGLPEIDTAGAVSEGVVADSLPATSSFTVALASANTANGEISRAATVSLALGAPQGGATYANNFALRLSYNAVYGYNNDIINGLITCTNPCAAPVLTLPSGKKVYQWRPTATTTITGDPAAEDVVYINADFNPAMLSAGCNATACTVTNGAAVITMSNVNTLVFKDTSIGL
jgi:hypothetical protein